MELEKNDFARLFQLLIFKKNFKDYLIHHDVGLFFSRLKRLRHNKLYNNETAIKVKS